MTTYFFSFSEHSYSYNFYNFHKIIENFLNLLSSKFTPGSTLEKVKIKATFSTVNFQPQKQNGFVEITDSRIWSADVYECVDFSNFVRNNIERDIKRRIIINSQTGRNWQFERFNQITIHVILDNFKTNT